MSGSASVCFILPMDKKKADRNKGRHQNAMNLTLFQFLEVEVSKVMHLPRKLFTVVSLAAAVLEMPQSTTPAILKLQRDNLTITPSSLVLSVIHLGSQAYDIDTASQVRS